jgi:hypothetical protein
MKVSVLCSATLFSLATFAFPASMLKGDISEATLAEITALTEKISSDFESKRSTTHVKRAFNAEAQRISTTGDHKYVSGPIEMHDVRITSTNAFVSRLRQGPMISVDLALVSTSWQTTVTFPEMASPQSYK